MYSIRRSNHSHVIDIHFQLIDLLKQQHRISFISIFFSYVFIVSISFNDSKKKMIRISCDGSMLLRGMISKSAFHVDWINCSNRTVTTNIESIGCHCKIVKCFDSDKMISQEAKQKEENSNTTIYFKIFKTQIEREREKWKRKIGTTNKVASCKLNTFLLFTLRLFK